MATVIVDRAVEGKDLRDRNRASNCSITLMQARKYQCGPLTSPSPDGLGTPPRNIATCPALKYLLARAMRRVFAEPRSGQLGRWRRRPSISSCSLAGENFGSRLWLRRPARGGRVTNGVFRASDHARARWSGSGNSVAVFLEIRSRAICGCEAVCPRSCRGSLRLGLRRIARTRRASALSHRRQKKTAVAVIER